MNAEMWCAKRGGIAVNEHPIQLKPESDAANQVPNQQGPEMHAVTQALVM